jgi:hypothetical protein
MTKRAAVPVTEFASSPPRTPGQCSRSRLAALARTRPSRWRASHELRVIDPANAGRAPRLRRGIRCHVARGGAAAVAKISAVLSAETRDLDVIHGRLVTPRRAILPATDQTGVASTGGAAGTRSKRLRTIGRATLPAGKTRACGRGTQSVVALYWPFGVRRGSSRSRIWSVATRGQWRRLRKAADAAEADPAVENLHLVRIRTKTLRYFARDARAAAAIRRPAITPRRSCRCRTISERCKTQRSSNGGSRGALSSGRGDAFVVGELVGLERARKERVCATWETQWQRAARGKLRRWAR